MGLSLIQQAIARVGRASFKSWWDTLPAAEREMAARDWSLNARPEQLMPGSPGASSDRTNWRTWLLNAGRGFGKALALDTPIPTPGGWSTMGDLRVGDEVFDETGRPCRVTFATEIQLERQCYRVRFDDGSTIVADAEHRWLTWDKAARKAAARAAAPRCRPAVRTTEEIRASLRVQNGREANHSVKTRTGHRYIVEVSPVDSVPVRCIQVDSPSHLFLAGPSMIPTHNTRTGAETGTELVCSGRARSIALIAPTLKKARQLMIEKPRSGLLAVSRPDNTPRWYPGKNEIHWPNGARGYVFTSEKPDDLRGFEGDLAWCEEMGSWKYPGETWSNLQFGLRVPGPKGDQPRAIVTTTPRPIKALRDLIANPSTVVTGGSTYENAVNLDASALEDIKRQYEGTRLGRQELHAELLSDTPGALWTLALIDANRVRHAPPLKRVVIAIDPATKDPTAKRDSDEDYRGSLTGIVAAGIGPCRCRGKVEDHGFVLEDGSGIYTPREWAEKAVELMNRWGGDRVIGETNNGGALVESNLRAYGDERIPYRAVTASRGKQTRAEPISALDEQARIHHVGVHPELEDEMTTWQPLVSRKSPDRMDARVWALTELMLKSSSPPSFPSGSILPRRW